MKKEKVCCKNCKWNGGWFANIINYNNVKGWQWCEYPKEQEAFISKEFTGLEEREIVCPVRKSELNSKGECPRYEKKWWRKLLNLS